MNIKFVGANANNYQVGREGQQIKDIVCHWIVGSLESADATFQDPKRIASANYGVGDLDIHQYVLDGNTAYANGNLLSNRESISIEHEGGPTIPITDATYESSSQLIAHLSRLYNIPLDRNHIKKHNEVSDKPTQCPGTLDLDRLIKRAKEINNVPAQPTWNDQTKIPLNVVTVLDKYEERELQAIRSDYIDKDQSLKDLRSVNNQQSTIIKEYQTQVEDLNNDLGKTLKDFKEYKARIEAESVKEEPKSSPKPSSAFGLWLYDLAFKVG